MKKLLTLILCFALCLSITLPASATTVDTNEKTTASVEPRLRKDVTATLGNAWATVWTESNWLEADLEVTNNNSSAYDVKVQIVDSNNSKIIKEAKTIAPGKTVTFYNIPSGGYIIQGMSADGVAREYTLHLED